MNSHRHLAALAAAASLLASASLPAATAAEASFQSQWDKTPDRTWAGADFWANRLQDWAVKDGMLVCDCTTPRMGLRTLHLLTRRMGAENRPATVSVTTGGLPGKPESANSAGILVGVGEGKMDFRSAALVQSTPGVGAGIYACIGKDGHLEIRDNTTAEKTTPAPGRKARRNAAKGKRAKKSTILPLPALMAASKERLSPDAPVDLTLSLKPENADTTRLVLTGRDTKSGKTAEVSLAVPSARLVGNIALARETSGKNTAPRWFSKWSVSGERIESHPADTCGPIVCTQYTLSRGVMKLTAQMTPIGEDEPHEVRLQTKDGGAWKTIATTRIQEPSYTAAFRIPNWDDTKDTAYRVVYGKTSWQGTVRKDPKDKQTIVVAGFTGNHNNAWGFGNPGYNFIDDVYFPHTDMMEHVAMSHPDVLFFSGDQIYEGVSPTGADRAHIMKDYLYKWFLWCWAYRDYTKDIPTICEPDDHDVYQGNLWGQGGRHAPHGQSSGGYVQPPEFVKMVEQTQTSHLPDPFDPTPVGQGIGVYYTSMIYGGIGIAIIEDRKFKSGIEDLEHPGQLLKGNENPELWKNYQLARKRFDQKGKTMLGERQLKFLDAFARDWRGQKMKICLSQTIFAGMATHYAGGHWMAFDFDSNAWPSTPRNKAVDALRRGFMFHLAGDQHLATLVHHGIENHDDANWSMCVPSIANFYPRSWAPEIGPNEKYHYPKPSEYTGKRRDGMGHPVTVVGVANPGRDMGHEPKKLHNGMPGYGIVKMDKKTRAYTVECWPRFAVPGKDAQYPGWPLTIPMEDNYGRVAKAWLPTLVVEGIADPVVQVIDESNGETIYTIRAKGTSFRPKTFHPGAYTVRIGDQDHNNMKTLKGLKATPDNQSTKTLKF